MDNPIKVRLFTTCLAYLLLFVLSYEKSYSQESITIDSGKFVDLLKLTAAGNGYSDQTIVVFIPEATTGFDPQYDAYKLPGSNSAPQLYSIIPGSNLAINALPEILINLVVQLGFKVGVSTNYSITATELNSFSPDVSIYLDDTKNNVLTDLKANPVYSFTANPNDNIQRFKLYFRYPVYLNLKVFLEGGFSGNEMNTELNAGNYLPLNQPFNVSPWNYPGTESVVAIPNTDIVDWVLIEIRDAIDAGSAIPSTTIGKACGFLLKDGSVVGLDGSSNLIFKNTISENMYVVVWHRNHLGVISSASPAEFDGVYSYDFTSGADQAYGGISAQKEITPGIFAMIAGDLNADGIINETDKSSIWVPQTGTSGYLMGDGNMDGQVDNQSKNDLWLLNLNAESQIPE